MSRDLQEQVDSNFERTISKPIPGLSVLAHAYLSILVCCIMLMTMIERLMLNRFCSPAASRVDTTTLR